MLIDTLNKQYENAKVKKWNKIFFAIDCHDTIVKGNYVTDVLPTEFLKDAKETLQMLSKRTDVCLILYTCSHEVEIIKYLEFFKNLNIKFSHVNKNPEVPNTALGCYTDKLYFNILLDDKADFLESDWLVIKEFYTNKPELI